MEKRKCLAFLFFLILCYSLFQLTARAESPSHRISSQGNITYSPSNVNLAVIPDDWYLTYGSGTQIIFLDYDIVHTLGKPSIRLEPHVDGVDNNPFRECDCHYYSCKPGDHIVAKCWIRIDANGDTDSFSGARIGIDLISNYDSMIGRYPCVATAGPTYPNTEQDVINNYVHWGTVGWVQRTIDFIVPADYFTVDVFTGKTIAPAQVSSFGMWMQVWSSEYYGSEPGNAWFADAELYINPI
jgi:hypothetical protein